MSYNGSGTFQINSTGQPVVSGTVISSTAFNALTADLATGLSTAITKDGQTATTARIPFAQGINSTLVTDSTSTTTGSIITAGGAGVAKALFVGTTANVAGAVTLQSTLGVTGVTTVQAGTAALPAITTTGDTNTGIFFPAADTIAFAEGGAEAMRIDSDGDVGIGTSSPSNKFVVSASGAQGFEVNPDVSGTTEILTYNRSGSAWNPLKIITSTFKVNISGGSDALTVDSSGNLLVGETAVDDSGGLAVIPGLATGAPALLAFNKGNSASETCLRFKYQGTVVGSIAYSSTTTAYNITSDYRLKEDITPMTGALARNALLNPVKYKWKVDGSDGEGFVAHQLQNQFPSAVTGEKDAVDADGNPIYQGISTGPLDGHFAACVNELQAIIQEQQALIQALTTRITALENK